MSDISIWMPITWSDWMKDTAMLSLQEQGAYLMIVKEYWNNGGSLSDDKTRMDALNGLLYKDDSQVIDLQISKHYAMAPSASIAWRAH